MDIEKKLNAFLIEHKKSLMENDSGWVVKGFIDSHKTIYPIDNDTKVISKIIELLIFPKILEFANKNGLKVESAEHQNYYPDITLIDSNGEKYAVDLKSTYRIDDDTVNGMTLGAFTGYFRNQEATKNTVYPYASYKKHYVLGVIYSRVDIDINEFKTFDLRDLSNIKSVIRDIELFIQEKWKIATDKPGSGNTKNIGSEKNISKLKLGQGRFFEKYGHKGHKHFNLYWTEYETKAMAKQSERETPKFNDLKTYDKWLETLKV